MFGWLCHICFNASLNSCARVLGAKDLKHSTKRVVSATLLSSSCLQREAHNSRAPRAKSSGPHIGTSTLRLPSLGPSILHASCQICDIHAYMQKELVSSDLQKCASVGSQRHGGIPRLHGFLANTGQSHHKNSPGQKIVEQSSPCWIFRASIQENINCLREVSEIAGFRATICFGHFCFF